MQERYWNYLKEKRIYVYYLDAEAECSYIVDKAVKIYCALSSSTSIAAWVVWSQYSFVWAALIAVSHVITAVYDLLPFSKKLKTAAPFIKELKQLCNRIEHDWFQVSYCIIMKRSLSGWKINIRKRNCHWAVRDL